MSPERRFHAFVLAVTVAIMATALTYAPKGEYKILEIIVAVLTGTGVREMLLRTIEHLLEHWHGLKAFVLGSSFVEGKWVGFYVEEGRPILIIETVRQEWSAVFANGRAFEIDGREFGLWESVGAVVDGNRGIIQGVYSGHFQPGHYDSIVSFQLEGKVPRKMFGYVSDIVVNPQASRVWMTKEKIESNASDVDAICTALSIWESAPINALKRHSITATGEPNEMELD
jgi:hypothetical protein